MHGFLWIAQLSREMTFYYILLIPSWVPSARESVHSPWPQTECGFSSFWVHRTELSSNQMIAEHQWRLIEFGQNWSKCAASNTGPRQNKSINGNSSSWQHDIISDDNYLVHRTAKIKNCDLNLSQPQRQRLVWQSTLSSKFIWPSQKPRAKAAAAAAVQVANFEDGIAQSILRPIPRILFITKNIYSCEKNVLRFVE